MTDEVEAPARAEKLSSTLTTSTLRAGPFYAGLFLVSGSVLSLEVLDTRMLSVLTWYSLAFLVIAMGLFGLTAGAVSVYLRPQRYAPEELARSLSRDALEFCAAIPVSYVLLLIVPLRAERVATIVPLFVVFAAILALPFYPAGKIVAAALTRAPLPVGRVYAVDLAGAALGAPLVPFLLERLGGGSAILSVSLLAALAAVCFARASSRPASPKAGFVALGLAAVFTFANTWSDKGLVPLWVKGRAETRDDVELEVWNSHSRVLVHKPLVVPAAFWGKGDKCAHPWLLQRGLEIDGHAATPLYLVGDDLHKLLFLDCDVTNAVHRIRPKGPIAIIGVGGSRDIQAAIIAGHSPIVGIELNDRLLEILRGELGKGAGLEHRDSVKLVHDEARSYLTRHSDKYSVIQASLIDTWAATGAGAHALSENGLYTVEGFRLFLSRLEPGGVFTVSRWASAETPRLVGVAMAALFSMGVESPRDHIALLAAGPATTLLVGLDPLTPAEVAALDALAKEKGFIVAASPGSPSKIELLENILAAENRKDLSQRSLLPLMDLRPSTDDRPFFFNVVRPSAMWATLPPESAGLIEGNLLATRTLALSFFASLVLVTLAIAVPLYRRAKPEGHLDKKLVAGLVYFSAIGVGFMLAEISLLQRLSLVLGHPSYSLMVVLSSLIGAMGLGSLISDKLPLDRKPWAFVFPVVLFGVVFALAHGWSHLAGGVASAPTSTRIGFAIGVCGVLGLVLGVAFPVGMRLARKAHDAETPWLWGINGVGSVLASSLAMLIALGFGLTNLMIVGAVCYLFLIPAAWVLLGGSRSAK